MKKVLLLLLTAFLLFTVVACKKEEKPAGDKTAYKAGTYKGTAKGKNGDVTV